LKGRHRLAYILLASNKCSSYPISRKLATTCSLLAVAAVTLSISDSCTTRGVVSNSTVVFALTALTLNKLKTEAPLVIVTVIVSALPESSDTNIDLNIDVVATGHVYSVVTDVAVKSNFAFL
tara:strand:+ start:371 stop:736 length:366 start_codon:yes stop_codon:yes gene_type:complete